MKNKTINIAGTEITAGSKTTILLPSANLYTQTKMDIPCHIYHGHKAGPSLFVIGTIHGDELNSIEIIRRVQHHSALKTLHGTLILIPVANIFGLMQTSRYLPDRRDLNRSFPGSKNGSMAARLAYTLIQEIVGICQYGIDLHTGAIGRTNMPQLRVNLETPGATDLANAFGVPIIIDAKLRDGSLRQAVSELGIPLLVYEGGEALRYNEIAIRMGVRGILNVLAKLGMITAPARKSKKVFEPVIAKSTAWVRASVSGFTQTFVDIAETVQKGDLLANIHDPFLMNPSVKLISPYTGIIIGKTNSPLVNEGDALYHIASIEELEDVTATIEELREEFMP